MTGTKGVLLGTAALLAAGAAVATQGPAKPAWAKKPFGLLLIVPEGGRDLSSSLTDISKRLSKKFPMDSALSTDVRDIQKAVDRLLRKRVGKIVAVPLLLSSHSVEMDQNRYIFGIRRAPSGSLISGRSRYGYAPLKRAKSKVPLILMPALDDHEIAAQVLAVKALGPSRDAEKEILIIVTEASEGNAGNTQWLGGIKALGERARSIAGFKEVHTFFLPTNVGQEERDKARREFRGLVRDLRRNGRVIVVPLSVTKGALHTILPKILDGTFAKIVKKGLLPDARIIPWVEESARKGAKLPDMRIFTEEVALRPKTKKLKKKPFLMQGKKRWP